MNRQIRLKTQLQRTGAMLPMVAFVMIILIIGAVFSVDIAHMHMVRAELRTATDGAARAGAETLARTQDPEAAIDAAIRVASLNRVSGEGLELERSDVVLGSVQETDSGRFEFVPNEEPFSTVRVVGRRDASSPQGAVPLFFGSLLGVENFNPVQAATASSSVIDIALVLDRSGSMATPDAGGGLTRSEALENAVNVFIDEIRQSSPNAAISVVTYSTAATTDQQLTADLDQVSTAVQGLTPDGFTNIRQGLLFGSDTLQTNQAREFANRVVIVMTDGNFNVGGTPLPSAQIAANRGHTIHTVTFSTGANQAIMQQVAAVGSGDHFHADDAGDLTEAFRQIARSLEVLLIE